MNGPVLYAEGTVRVTPSWIGVGDVSHAAKNVVRLRRVEHVRARGSWRALFWTMLLLAGLSASLAVRTNLAFALVWVPFSASTVFALVAAWHAFVAADAFGVEVGLADGTRFEAPAADRRQMERLHGALAHALDWHGGTPIAASGAGPGSGRGAGTGAFAGVAAGPAGAARPARGFDASADDVVRVIDEHGRVIREHPVAVDPGPPDR